MAKATHKMTFAADGYPMMTVTIAGIPTARSERIVTLLGSLDPRQVKRGERLLRQEIALG